MSASSPTAAGNPADARGSPAHPLLYEINTRVLLGGIARRLGRPASFDDIPDEALQAVAELGFDWIWFLGVWQTGEAARAISRTHASWQDEFHQALPDLTPADICGSPFAIAAFEVDAAYGGNAALARLRERARAAGLRLMLDFVPNHVAPDHPWVRERPSLFVRGSEAELAAEPRNWTRAAEPRNWTRAAEPQNSIRAQAAEGPLVLAHGRDPYFPGWPDTVQLDYANPKTQAAMGDVLLDIAGRCDGVRCDMAMLLLPEVFERCWGSQLHGRRVAAFWPDTIRRLRASHPEFRLMAEVYWGLEATLIGQGFDFAYDKGLYDALQASDAARVRELLSIEPAYQSHLARFLENHDEPRAAATFGTQRHKAAAVLTFCAPGLRFIHQGQLEGARAQIPVHLGRGPAEDIDTGIHGFYLGLLSVLRDPVLRYGSFEVLAVDEAWEGNPSHAAFAASVWSGPGGSDGGGSDPGASNGGGPRLLCLVNYRADRGQCRVRLNHPSLSGRPVSLSDRLGPERYVRDGDALAGEGLYLDLPGWGYNVFTIG